MKLADYDYFLPPELIAQRPARRRDLSRLLVLDRAQGTMAHRRFHQVVSFLSKGDVLVINDTKVVPARLIGRRASGGRVEIFLLRKAADHGPSQNGRERYQALIKPLGRLRLDEEIFFKDGSSCRLLDAKNKIVEFVGQDGSEVMRRIGRIPLPPYIRREPEISDRQRYQTVFAREEGAVAAPTAGLHFTKPLLKALRQKGVLVAPLTLHVSYATFAPLRTQDIREHQMQAEDYHIPASTAALIRRAKKSAKKVFAVGTTVTRALEDRARAILDGPEADLNGSSRLFIYPPFDFKIVDALITNFHLPRTSLLMLVAAFAGHGAILKAYAEAIRQGYRFYSYGDAMLIM